MHVPCARGGMRMRMRMRAPAVAIIVKLPDVMSEPPKLSCRRRSAVPSSKRLPPPMPPPKPATRGQENRVGEACVHL